MAQYNRVSIVGGMSVQLIHFCPEVYPAGKTPEYIIAATARNSYNNFEQEKSLEDDQRLIKFLYRNNHTSPLEFASCSFSITAPKFVIIQLLRHRTGKFNEVSQRYSVQENVRFKPLDSPANFIRFPHEKHKQQTVTGDVSEEIVKEFTETEALLDQVLEKYEKLISLGVGKECARFCLPMSLMSQLQMQMDASNLLKFFKLRMDPHAQFETRLVAWGMYLLFKQIFPTLAEVVYSDDMKIDESFFTLEKI